MFNWFVKKSKDTTNDEISIVSNDDVDKESKADKDTIKFVFCDNDLKVKCPNCDETFSIREMNDYNKTLKFDVHHKMTLYKSKLASRFRLDITCPECKCRFEKYYKISEVKVSEIVDISNDVKVRLNTEPN